MIVDVLVLAGLGVATLSTRSVGVIRTVRAAAWLAQSLPAVPGARHSPKEIERRVRRASALLPPADCVPRAVVTRIWCRLAHHDARLLVGMRRRAGRLEGHAWVVVQDQQLFHDVDANYTVVFDEARLLQSGESQSGGSQSGGSQSGGSQSGES